MPRGLWGICSLTLSCKVKKPWWRKTWETFGIGDLLKTMYLKKSPQKFYERKPKKLLKKSIAYKNGSRLSKLCEIVIRIYTLSSVCLPYIIYFVSFAELKQYVDWYNSRFADGWTQIARLATHILAFKNHSLAGNYLDVFQKVSKIFM